MKVRAITIKIDSMKETAKRFIDVYAKLEKGENVGKQEYLSFESIDMLRKIITNERLRLMKLIRTRKPKTIYALAKIAERPYPNVFNDVKKLEELGLIELEKENNCLEPVAKYEQLNIAIAV